MFRIDIRSGILGKNGDDFYRTDVFSFENGLYKSSPLSPIITEKGREKIRKIAKDLCETTFKERFGDVVQYRLLLAKTYERLKLTRWIAYTIAFSGWGVAAAMLILMK